jgi:hypothetical protein
MMRALVIVGTLFVVASTLAPRSADAQQIFACVLKSGQVRIIAHGASCGPNEQLITWGGGTIAGADFECSSQFVPAGQPIGFQTQVLSFGGSIIYNSSGQFFTFAQTGIYQLKFSGGFSLFGNGAAIQLVQNGGVVGLWPQSPNAGSPSTVVGFRLISAQAGDVLRLIPNQNAGMNPGYPCELVIMQVQ